MAEAADGSFVIAGTVTGACNIAWLLKVDAAGSVVWSNTYGANDPGLSSCKTNASAVRRTSDDGFVVAGQVSGYFGLFKIDASGALQWIRTYPGGSTTSNSMSTALVEAPDGSLAAVGSWISPSTQFISYRVLKTDASGNIVWQKTLGGPQSDLPLGIANGAAGSGFVVTGQSQSFGGMWTVALDDQGSIIWQKAYGSPGETAHAIIPTTAGGYGLVAQTSPSVRATLFELDGSGAPLWARKFGSGLGAAAYSNFNALVGTFDGGFLAVGEDITTDPSNDQRLLAVKVDAGGAFVGCLGEEDSPTLAVTPTNASTVSLADGSVDEAANATVTAQEAITTDTDAPERLICSGTLPQTLEAAALAVDPSGNGVADPGEQFAVEPSWTNFGLSATTLTGQTSALSDSNGLDTGAPDPLADYGTVASLATADCSTATGDCYALQFLGTPRPSQHWDTYADETLTTSDPHHQFAKRWKIHAGLSFGDVDPSSGFYPFIENIFHNGITVGCGGTSYCPTSSTTRGQMAVFLLKSKYGADHVPPPATGTVFNDVPADAPFAAWIEELAALGITGGCGGGDYCPTSAVTRQQMSAFLLKELNGAGYVPPPAVGLFGDVPQDSLFAAWIEDLYNHQITAGCSTSPLLYCPADPNTRAQMAVFLTKTFSLVLYGP
jgi:hypothetical protein